MRLELNPSSGKLRPVRLAITVGLTMLVLVLSLCRLRGVTSAYADDGINVQAATEVAGDPQAAGFGAWLSAEPNPFSGRTRVAFSLPGRSRVDVSVYDVHGRLVQQLVDGPLEAGSHRTWWDGRDRSGASVAGGVYFCRIKTDGWEKSLKVMLVR